MIVLPYRGQRPLVAPDAFIAPNASLIGDVEIGPGASIWFNCVLRGDVRPISVGANTNIQDGTVVHVTYQGHATIIGAGVTVGHSALIHACTLEDGSFVGMGAVVMDGCVVESEGMVAAGALLTPGKRVKRGELWAGRPAKLLRRMDEDELARIRWTAEHYAALAAEYRAVTAASG